VKPYEFAGMKRDAEAVRFFEQRLGVLNARQQEQELRELLLAEVAREFREARR
jgi:hypothetical protein